MDKIKQILGQPQIKKSIIWTATIFVMLSIIMILIHQTNSEHITAEQCFVAFLTFPFQLIATLVYFLPGIFAIVLVFHFSKDVQNIFYKNTLRILSISFFIPFNNYIYFLIISKITNDTLPLIPVIIALYGLFVLIPLTALTALVIPKKYFEKKFFVLITSCLMFVIGWLFVFGTIRTEEEITRLKEYHELSYYTSTIDFIEEHGERFHKYPKLIGEIFQKGKYNKIDYQTFNSQQDYVLRVYNEGEDKELGFRYCSSKNLYGCDETIQEQFFTRELIGGWVHTTQKKN